MIVRFLARHFRSHRQALAMDYPPHIPVAECLHALESRYMFDAAGVATGAEAAVDAVAQEQAEQAVDGHLNHSGAAGAGQTSDASPADTADADDQLLEALATHEPPAGRHEVVFVDTSVEDYQKLIAGIDPSAEIVLLDPTRDGVEQIADVLAGRSGIDAIHIVSHGSQAELRLGTARLTLDSMTGRYVDELATIGQALSDEADILVYGCNFGEGGEGQEAAAQLATKTGADVAASEDATGHATLGGDWDLELRIGRVDTTAALTSETQESFRGLLAPPGNVRDDFSPSAYNGNDGSDFWSTDWQEVNDNGNPTTGNVYASGGVLNLHLPFALLGNSPRGAWREADLSQAVNATLSFDYQLSAGGLLGATTIDVQVSDNGGPWFTLFTTGGSTGWQTQSVAIPSAYVTANTQIRLLASSAGLLVGGDVQFDNVEIRYEAAPVITSNGGGATANVTVAENTTAVTTVSATDADLPAQSLTYSLIGGADQALFSINPSTGALSFNTAPNFEAPADAGANNVYDVTVQVSDGNGGTDTQAITVMVTDANDAPVITSNGGATTASVNVAENTTAVTTVSATDADLPAQGLTYNIIGGADQGLFSINPSTGALSFNTAPNFEAPADAGANNVYGITVHVSDGAGGIDTQVIAVTVNDVNEPPVVNDQAFSVAENTANGTPVGTVIASDVDAGDTRTFSITAGNTGGAFAIDNAGVITVANMAALDFETNPTFTLTVQVQDTGGLTDTATVTVNLININDAPVVTSNGGGASASVSIAENTAAVTTVAATDADVPAQSLTYSLIGGADQGLFSINPSTGALSFNAAPNFEAPADAGANNVYDVTVQVSDGNGGTDMQAIAVTVTNVNELPVVNDQAFSVAENSANGTLVGTLAATDPDVSATLNYNITAGNTGGAFAINTATGQITVANAAALDFETNPTFTLTVQVQDAGGLTDTVTVTVTLADVNEAPASDDQPSNRPPSTPGPDRQGGERRLSPEDEADTLTASSIAGAPTMIRQSIEGLARSSGRLIVPRETTERHSFKLIAQQILSPTAPDQGGRARRIEDGTRASDKLWEAIDRMKAEMDSDQGQLNPNFFLIFFLSV